MNYLHNQICTDGGEIEIGRNYAYFEDFPNAIACVEMLEDNSDDESIKFKLKVIKALHPSMKEGHVFECSAVRGFYAYDGMWKIKHFNIANILSALSPAKVIARDGGTTIEPMPMEHVKTVCKIGGPDCCRFLILGSTGFECASLDSVMKAQINERADAGKMNAIGKNCNGFSI